MKLVILSDSHGMHEKVSVPNGDILIHCGDCTDDAGQASLRNFLRWFDGQPHATKIFIAGNHDGAFEKWNLQARAMVEQLTSSIIYLEDSGCVIDKLHFWGSPVSPSFCNWHFNRDRGADIKRHWDMIPRDVDVLITHCPPYGYLDVSGIGSEKCGCRDLYEAVLEIQPRLHCFGHIHHSYGTTNLVHDNGNKTILVNSSICDEEYRPIRHPFVIDL